MPQLRPWLSGVPVIVTDSGGPMEIITNKKDGIVIPPNNSEAIAVEIQECISNNKLMTQLSKQAKFAVKNKFSIDKMIDAYTSLYGEVLW